MKTIYVKSPEEEEDSPDWVIIFALMMILIALLAVAVFLIPEAREEVTRVFNEILLFSQNLSK